jgi:hypothetical protein
MMEWLRGKKCANIIGALSTQSVPELNISPGRWQHVWLVAIVPTERWGEMDRNDCYTAWGNFKTLMTSLNHHKNCASSFSLIVSFFFLWLLFLSLLLCNSQLFQR